MEMHDRRVFLKEVWAPLIGLKVGSQTRKCCWFPCQHAFTSSSFLCGTFSKKLRKLEAWPKQGSLVSVPILYAVDPVLHASTTQYADGSSVKDTHTSCFGLNGVIEDQLNKIAMQIGNMLENYMMVVLFMVF